MTRKTINPLFLAKKRLATSSCKPEVTDRFCFTKSLSASYDIWTYALVKSVFLTRAREKK